MPNKVTAYACQFKCGYKVQTKRYRMVAHEKICFRNPERRACQTCKHSLLDGDVGWWCDLEPDEPDVVLMWGCFAWEATDAE